MKTTKELEKEIEKFEWNIPYYNDEQRLNKQKLLKVQLQTLKDAKKKFTELIDELRPKHLFLDELKLFIKELKQKLEEI